MRSAAVACAAIMAAAGRSGIRLDLARSGASNVETGLPVLDHLLDTLARYAEWSLALEVEPGTGEAEADEAGSALGGALKERILAGRGYGYASMTVSEALASVVLERSEQPLVVTNVDLTGARVAGLGTDVARRFLDRLAEAASVTLHVRLLNGTDTQHVLEAIFKALGVALAQACATEGDV
jgi:imidazoleglycerol-phosphate dehydratase